MLRLSRLLGLVLVLAWALPAASEAPAGRWDAAFSSLFGGASVTGDWRVVESDGQRFLELGEDFKAQSAPDLKLFLSPLAPEAVNGDNAVQGAVRLGLLPAVEGRQRLAIPKGVDLADYRSVVLHCEQYSKLWGTGALAEAAEIGR